MRRKEKSEEILTKTIGTCGPTLEFDDELEKSIHDFNKLIEAQNKSFNKMTKLEKRVALAEDVLKQLSLNKYKAVAGTYLTLRNGDDRIDLTKKNTQKDSIVCECCAIGSLFLSNITMGGGRLTSYKKSMLKSLSSIFSHVDLMIIEGLFENCVRYVLDENVLNTFNDNFKTRREKMIGIMQNLINNEGRLIINDETLIK